MPRERIYRVQAIVLKRSDVGEADRLLTLYTPDLGKLRAIAITGDARSSMLPQVPTFAEAGLAGYEADLWWGLFAPPKMAKERLARDLVASPPSTIGSHAVRPHPLDTKDGVKFFLDDGSWLLIRFSGTEPLVRVYAEATSAELRDELLEYYLTDTAEDSLIPQWEPCVLFDQTERLPECRVPMHVIAFEEDVQAVPQDGEEVADLVPGAELHLFPGMGHCSIYGHTHDVLNPFIAGLVQRYV